MLRNSNVENGTSSSVSKKSKCKSTGKKLSLRKEDIGKPMDFRHVQHVGWDLDHGFDLDAVDPAFLTFLESAGVSRSQLEDAGTREFIYNFIKTYQSKRMSPPSPTHAQPVTPPPMSTENHLSQSKGQRPVSIQPSSLLQQHGNKAQAPPPPPTTNIPPSLPERLPAVTTINSAPPPRPPMRMDVGIANSDKMSKPPPPPEADRSQLPKQVQNGITLKKADSIQSQTKSTGGLSDCLDQIKTGVDLKKTLVAPKIPQSTEELDDLAGALSRALAARFKAINPESSSSGEEDDDGFDEDEWE